MKHDKGRAIVLGGGVGGVESWDMKESFIIRLKRHFFSLHGRNFGFNSLLVLYVPVCCITPWVCVYIYFLKFTRKKSFCLCPTSRPSVNFQWDAFFNIGLWKVFLFTFSRAISASVISWQSSNLGDNSLSQLRNKNNEKLKTDSVTMSRYFQGRCHAAVSDSVMLSFKFTSLRLQTNEPFSSDWKKIKQNILVISQNFNTFEGSF